MLVAGNWKMHGSQAMAKELLAAFGQTLNGCGNKAPQLVVFPPATLLAILSGEKFSAIHLGGQDCHAEASGAYTGDVSVEMLKEAGASYVLVGHSERRQYHQESNAQICAKAVAAYKGGLMPVICIGETASQRENGEMQAVLKQQIEESVPDGFTAEDFVLAYEPVWAIGTGKVATPEIIEQTHYYIEQLVPNDTQLLYGGSVKPSNVAEILALKPVHGVLVGGASLKAEQFCPIIEAAANENS